MIQLLDYMQLARMQARLFDDNAPIVVRAQYTWQFAKEGPLKYGWKKSNVNLLYSEKAGQVWKKGWNVFGARYVRSTLLKTR